MKQVVGSKKITELKIYKILSDVILVDNLHLELHPNCTLDDTEDALYELSELYSKANNEVSPCK